VTDFTQVHHLLCDPERPVPKDGVDYRFTCASKCDNELTWACTGSEHRAGLEIICTCPCHQEIPSVTTIKSFDAAYVTPDGKMNVEGLVLNPSTATTKARVRVTVEILDCPEVGDTSYSFTLDEAVISNSREVKQVELPDGGYELVSSPDVTWSITGTELDVPSH